ncbi:MAG: DNA mismatch endonuclease Vsr [Desulfomonile tiedjei]|nr:DNA mismatch endonuclease Vsr [Desulfomonile tiedjei]
MMSAVRSKNTRLELELRRRLFSMGFRYRLHRKDLPGKPDIVFPKSSAVIFIHGCFWHQHGCQRSKLPATRHDWWKEKLDGNRCRDIEAIDKLKSLGWRVMVVWECSSRRKGVFHTDALHEIAAIAAAFLKSGQSFCELPRHSPKNNDQMESGSEADGYQTFV